MKALRQASEWTLRALLLLAALSCVWSYLRFVKAEVAPFPPRWDDQGYYLVNAHQYYSFMRQNGLSALLRLHFGHDQQLGFYPFSNLNMSLLAAVIYTILGPGRIGALSILLGSWLALIGVTAWVFRTVSEDWAYGAFVVGILLATNFGFVGPGGITDFRPDFAAACWFGMSVALWCLALESQERDPIVWATIVNCALITFRPIALLYWAPLWVLVGLWALMQYRQGEHARAVAFGRALAAIFAFNAAFILWDHTGLIRYYVGHHINPVELAVRAARDGVTGKPGSTTFYLRMLLWTHFGKRAWALLTAVMLALAGLRFARISGHLEKLARPRLFTVAFAAFATLAPIVILTASPQRTPQVAGITAPTLGVACLLFVGRLLGWRRGGIAVPLIAAAALAWGTWSWHKRLQGSAPYSADQKPSMLRLDEIYHQIVEQTHGYTGHSIRPGFTSSGEYLDLTRSGERNPLQLTVLDWAEGLNQSALTLYAQERMGVDQVYDMEVPRFIFSVPHNELRTSMERADVAIIPLDRNVLLTRPYPISHSLWENYDDLVRLLHNRMTLLARFRYLGTSYEVLIASKNLDASAPGLPDRN